MPESITEEERLFANSVYDSIDKVGYGATNKSVLMKLALKRNELEFIGYGAECAVITQHGHDHRVTAFKYSEVEPMQMKKIFYVQRILSTLFPHNFPRFYTVFYRNGYEKVPSGSIRQKINVLFDFDKENFSQSKYEEATKYSFRDATKKLDSLEVPIHFDLFSGNYNVGPDGGEYYLDTPILYFSHKWNKQKIIQYMQQQKTKQSEYSDMDIRLVSKSIDRLRQLGWN